MKKVITIISFKIGVDILGFPNFINHTKKDFLILDGVYFKSFSKK